MTQPIRLKTGLKQRRFEARITKADFEHECARRGFTFSKAVMHKDDWNQSTHYYVEGKLIGVAMKGERPNWKQMMEDLK